MKRHHAQNKLKLEMLNLIYYDSYLNIRNQDTWNYRLFNIIEAYQWAYKYIHISVQICFPLLNFNFNISKHFISLNIYSFIFSICWTCTFRLSYTRTRTWLWKITCSHVYICPTIDFYYFKSMQQCTYFFSLFY